MVVVARILYHCVLCGSLKVHIKRGEVREDLGSPSSVFSPMKRQDARGDRRVKSP